MRKRKEIEKQVGLAGSHYHYQYEQITVELLLDIRDLLLKRW